MPRLADLLEPGSRNGGPAPEGDLGGHRAEFWNEDCVTGAPRRLAEGEVDLIVTDPPYGIGGDTLHKHYNRDETYVVDGYVEVPREDYPAFTRDWIGQAARVLRPGGSLYLLSGWSNLRVVLDALNESGLEERNHVVWKYNFGVHTTRKYVSSHYHILYWTKPGARPTFDRFARFGESERDEAGRSLQYQDLEDVWIINREYKPGRVKNKNQLPVELLVKILQYSSRPGDLVCDFFLGSFSTAKVALGMDRSAVGFEINRRGFRRLERETRSVRPGVLRSQLRRGRDDRPKKRGAPWKQAELDSLEASYQALRGRGATKKSAIETLSSEFQRGRFAILNALARRGL